MSWSSVAQFWDCHGEQSPRMGTSPRAALKLRSEVEVPLLAPSFHQGGEVRWMLEFQNVPRPIRVLEVTPSLDTAASCRCVAAASPVPGLVLTIAPTGTI